MLKINCEINTIKNLSELKMVFLTNIYVKCDDDIRLQLTVFHKRGNFYWTGNDRFNISELKWFGDVSRAVNM